MRLPFPRLLVVVFPRTGGDHGALRRVQVAAAATRRKKAISTMEMALASRAGCYG